MTLKVIIFQTNLLPQRPIVRYTNFKDFQHNLQNKVIEPFRRSIHSWRLLSHHATVKTQSWILWLLFFTKIHQFFIFWIPGRVYSEKSLQCTLYKYDCTNCIPKDWSLVIVDKEYKKRSQLTTCCPPPYYVLKLSW